jgi:hypothetical protein
LEEHTASIFRANVRNVKKWMVLSRLRRIKTVGLAIRLWDEEVRVVEASGKVPFLVHQRGMLGKKKRAREKAALLIAIMGVKMRRNSYA